MNSGDKKQELIAALVADPEGADREIFGRIPHADRRGFLKGAGLATMTAMLGVTSIPFSRNMPSGFIPVAMAEEAKAEAVAALTGKDGLTGLGDKPLNAETPAHLLDDEVTPTARHFVRNHGTVPSDVDVNAWTLTVDGEVETPLKLTIQDLRKKFKIVTQQLVIECGGNGRAFFNPPVSGNQWTVGAVGCASWTGVLLRDILKAAKVKKDAVYTAHFGADRDLADPEKLPISRGIPIEKAMNPGTLVAFEMNGAPMHPMNGHPLRLVVPGWVGSASHKWLTRIQLRNTVHDGKGMAGQAYRMPNRPLEPGEKAEDALFGRIITAMPVKSLITYPATGFKLEPGKKTLEVRGHAWAGEHTVKTVKVSVDFGATWVSAKVAKPANPYAWQRWHVEVTLPGSGYYEIWAQATDDKGVTQPFSVAWNPKGYMNNAVHRVAVRVA